eukprot:3790912-Rhodomonas_salina.1
MGFAMTVAKEVCGMTPAGGTGDKAMLFPGHRRAQREASGYELDAARHEKLDAERPPSLMLPATQCYVKLLESSAPPATDSEWAMISQPSKLRHNNTFLSPPPLVGPLHAYTSGTWLRGCHLRRRPSSAWQRAGVRMPTRRTTRSSCCT